MGYCKVMVDIKFFELMRNIFHLNYDGNYDGFNSLEATSLFYLNHLATRPNYSIVLVYTNFFNHLLKTNGGITIDFGNVIYT